MSMNLTQRRAMVLSRLCEPKAWSRAGVEVEEEFQVKAPVKPRGTAGPVYYSGIVGLRLVGGGVRYRCANETCSLMYESAPGAAQHLGLRHPSDRAKQRRDALNEELKAAGLEPIDYAAAAADALITSVIAGTAAEPEPEPEPEPAPEPEPEAALFPAERPEAVSGSIVPPGPKRRGRPPGKRQLRDIEDTLDFMGTEIADNAKTSIDYLIKSRDDNRRAYREAMDELARVTAERNHLADVLMRIHTMTFGVEIMEIGGTENGK